MISTFSRWFSFPMLHFYPDATSWTPHYFIQCFSLLQKSSFSIEVSMRITTKALVKKDLFISVCVTALLKNRCTGSKSPDATLDTTQNIKDVSSRNFKMNWSFGTKVGKTLNELVCINKNTKQIDFNDTCAGDDPFLPMLHIDFYADTTCSIGKSIFDIL